jgi:ATP synthase protein I
MGRPCLGRRELIEGRLTMAEHPDPERLRALEARIAKVKGAPKPERTERGKAFSQGEMAWRMVVELVTGMLLGLSIGFGLDYVFNTRPVFLVIFALLGFAAGVRTMLGTAKAMATEHDVKQRGAAGPAKDEGDNG